MAQSPSHKFGQIIGDLLEAAVDEPLRQVAEEFGFYLDCKHRRPARGGKAKVAWRDSKGNSHDLDYVLEYDGSETVIGKPKAFIETAWRRYTKHSRNKAQEIQGAIIPLAETYHDCHPFLGVVLAGALTEGSLTQLDSHGFHILYYPYETVVAAFAKFGIDARFDEDTPDDSVQSKVDAFAALVEADKLGIVLELRRLREKQLNDFLSALRVSLGRCIKAVYIIPLHGTAKELQSVADAISFLNTYDESAGNVPLVRYEVGVRYTNGDEIRGQFHDKAAAIEFLRDMR